MLSDKSWRDEIRTEDALTLWDGFNTRPQLILIKVLTLIIKSHGQRGHSPTSLSLLCTNCTHIVSGEKSRDESTCFVVVMFVSRIVIGSICLRGFGKFGLRTDTYCTCLIFMFFLSWEIVHFKVFQPSFKQSEAPSVNKCMLDRDGTLWANSVFFWDTIIIDALNPGNIKTETGSVMIPHICNCLSIEAFHYIKLSDGYSNFGIIFFFFCFFYFRNVHNVTIFLKGKSKQQTMWRTALAAELFCRYQFPALFIFEFFHLFNYFFSHFALDTAAPSPTLPPSLPLPRCHCASHPAQGLWRYFKRIWEINLTANWRKTSNVIEQ